MKYEVHARNEASGKISQDQYEYWPTEEGVVIAFADGAGGSGDGLHAAKATIQCVKSHLDSLVDAAACEQVLKQADHQISGGESTGIVIVIRNRQLFGASAGDSGAMIVNYEEVTNLTSRQNQKPRLGSRLAKPVGFEESFEAGVLIVSSDGFWNYVKRDRLILTCANLDFPVAGKQLTDLVRLKSGELIDDVGIVIARRSRQSSSGRRLVIKS
jgi:serine/threonine protein phosphatase PrpC